MPTDNKDPGFPPQRAWSSLVSTSSRGFRDWLERRFGDWSLSTKLLALTALFVMLAEIVIFVPSIANFRSTWLNDRLTAAQLAALAAKAYPGGSVPAEIRQELLETAKVTRVSVKRDQERQLVLDELTDTGMIDTYDLRPPVGGGLGSALAFRMRLVRDALEVFFRSDTRMIRVIGSTTKMPGQYVDIVLPQAPLKAAMVAYSINILVLSVLISMLAGGLVYLTLRSFLIEPLMRLTDNMLHFSAKPEDASRIIVPTKRGDELGTAERELAHMQGELNQILAQKSRLAALGLAVSKINHDLRNMLASAQLLSDNLTSVQDPRVQRFAPKLIASLDRAINFCNDTLKFGRAAEAAPRRELIPLRPLVEEVAETLMLPRAGSVDLEINIGPNLRIDVDRDHLYRILSNLMRNAAQAIEAQTPPISGKLSLSAQRSNRRVLVTISDDGPGLPDVARAHLFEAFQGSTRRGGSGLGLAIASELVTVHGGTLTLVDTPNGAPGTTFEIVIPDRIVTAA